MPIQLVPMSQSAPPVLTVRYEGSERTFAPGNDVFWRMVKFLHAMGSGAVPEMLRDMRENGAAPADWAAIRQYALEHREALRDRFRRRFGKPFDPVHFTENVDKAFTRGKQLAQQVAMP